MAVATGTALALGGAALVGGGLQAYMQSEATKKAARSQANAVKRSQDIFQQQYQKAEDIQQPFLEQGQQAFMTLADLARSGMSNMPQAPQVGQYARPFSMADILSDPGAQYRQDQAMKAVERAAAARGRTFSGGTLQELLRNASGLASQETGAAFGRYATGQGLGAQQDELRLRQFGAQQDVRQQALQNLAGIAGTGTSLAQGLGNQAIGQGAQMANLQQALGNISAARAQGMSQAYQQPVNSVLGMLPMAALMSGGSGGAMSGGGAGTSGAGTLPGAYYARPDIYGGG
jgi:hypothetical protein